MWDNGEGMSPQALGQWAVMNLSMEDRGLQPVEARPSPASGEQQRGAGRFLGAQLSFFGVRLPRDGNTQ